MKVSFVGGGAMGEAMVRGIIGRAVAAPSDITVCDIDAQRRIAVSQAHGTAATAHCGTAVHNADVLVIAVKPQNLAQLMTDLSGTLEPGQLVLSIVAGASLATLRVGLGHEATVRAMPNTPAQLGEGFTLWTASPDASEGQLAMARAILGALGREVYTTNERYLDMATAVSGSGPAYVFLVIEALIDAAVLIGLPRDIAEGMVLQTVLGSARLAQESGQHPAQLRDMVTSPGGTTAEGILQLEEGGLRALMAHAVIAAYEKAKALGG